MERKPHPKHTQENKQQPKHSYSTTTTAAMRDDPDACLPAPVKDFVFDLHDSARRSMIQSEQEVLYKDTFRDLSQKVRLSFRSFLNFYNYVFLFYMLQNIFILNAFIFYAFYSILKNLPGHRKKLLHRNVVVINCFLLFILS